MCISLAADAETLAANVDISAKRSSKAQGRLVREALQREGIVQAIDAIVLALLASE